MKPRDDSASGEDGAAVFAAMSGTDEATFTRERPGMSAFALESGVVCHTYSAYARGLDGLWGMYQWLDRAPKGRNKNGRRLVASPRRAQGLSEGRYDRVDAVSSRVYSATCRATAFHGSS